MKSNKQKQIRQSKSTILAELQLLMLQKALELPTERFVCKLPIISKHSFHC